MNGSGIKQGPAIILKVMSGDTVDLCVRYFYNNAGSTTQAPLSPTDLLGGLAGGLFSITGGTHGAISDLTNGTTSPLVGALNSWVNDPAIPAAADKPKAYLNWILLDNQFRYVGGMVGTNSQSGALQVGDAGTVNGQLQVPLAVKGLPISKSGYLYIYLSNVTEHQDVFFDNLSVVHYSGPMVEENHYYPFGLTMAGISDKAMKGNYAENKYRYNKGSELQNKEFSDGSGLELYATNYRSLDPQLGRFWQIDPFTDVNEDVSTYSFAGNNPILLNDPFGLLSDSSHPQERAQVTVTGHKKSSFNLIPLSFSQPKPLRDGVTIGLRTPRTENFRIIPAAEANKGFTQPPYPSNSNVREFKTTTVRRFVRVSNRASGNKAGSWVVEEGSIRTMNAGEIQKNLALKDLPDLVGYVDVPAGTTLRAGPIGANAFGPGNPNIIQYQIMDMIPDGAFLKPISIENIFEMKWEYPELNPIKTEPIEPVKTESIEPVKPIS